MANESNGVTEPRWRTQLPVLAGRLVTLREPVSHDLGPLVDLLSFADATRFGMDEAVTELSVQEMQQLKLDLSRTTSGAGGGAGSDMVPASLQRCAFTGQKAPR